MLERDHYCLRTETSGDGFAAAKIGNFRETFYRMGLLTEKILVKRSIMKLRNLSTCIASINLENLLQNRHDLVK